MELRNYTHTKSRNIVNAARRVALSLAMLICLSAQSQVSHVTICNPSAPSGKEYLDVYEFDYVDVQPQFPGGESALINYVNKTREYPYEAYHRKVQGRVLCSFIVGKDGKVSNAKVIRGASDESLNREALRVIRLMPKWTVGKVGGAAVAVRVVLPIAFRL